MSEQPTNIIYCPCCGESNNDIRGRTEDGRWIMHCRGCDIDWAIEEVTGRLKIEIKISQEEI